jgi:hypothetical protein
MWCSILLKNSAGVSDKIHISIVYAEQRDIVSSETSETFPSIMRRYV